MKEAINTRIQSILGHLQTLGKVADGTVEISKEAMDELHDLLVTTDENLDDIIFAHLV
jgi:hypothetical protein